MLAPVAVPVVAAGATTFEVASMTYFAGKVVVAGARAWLGLPFIGI
jgi:hypothetical protein